jgi:putative flippase GtrA
VRRSLADQRFQFLLVGGINVLQGIGWFAVLQLLLGDFLPYILVLVLVYVISIPIAFSLYRVLVFTAAGPWPTELARFTLVQAASFAVNMAALPFFHELLGVPLLISQILSIGVVVVFNYTGHLYFSFRAPRRSHR